MAQAPAQVAAQAQQAAQAALAAHPQLANVLPDGVNVNEVRQWLANNAVHFQAAPGGGFAGRYLYVKNNQEYQLRRIQGWAPFVEMYQIDRVDRDAAGNEIFNQAGLARRMMYQLGIQAEPNAPNRFYYYSYPMGAAGQGWAQIGGRRALRRRRSSKRKSRKSRKSNRK